MREWLKQYRLRTRGRISTLEKLSFEEHAKAGEYLHAASIWIDPIPENPDLAVQQGVAACVTFTLDEDINVDNHRGYKPIEAVPPLISPSFGKGYIAEIRDAHDRIVPDGHETQPTLNYETGYLVFAKDPTPFFEPPFTVKAYAYIGRTLADFTGVPQLFPLGALYIPTENGYELQISFVDTTDAVAYVDVYGFDDGELVLIAENIQV